MSKIRNDIILIISLLLLAIITLVFVHIFSQKDNLCANVYHENELVLTIDFESLTEEKTYVIEGSVSKVVIKANNSGVWISEVDCDDESCKATGKISTSAETITCLPNKVVIKLVGKGVDVIV